MVEKGVKMDSIMAFFMGQANRGKDLMVFDWNKAAEIIKSRGADSASAGLHGDWGHGGDIFTQGKPNHDGYICVASTWATPELEINGEFIPCFIMENDVPKEWGDNLMFLNWPESALKIITA